MTPLEVLEGTWEELKLRESEFEGRRFRLTPLVPLESIEENTQTEMKAAKSPKKLQGLGRFKGKLGGTAALLREKQAEKEREERRF